MGQFGCLLLNEERQIVVAAAANERLHNPNDEERHRERNLADQHRNAQGKRRIPPHIDPPIDVAADGQHGEHDRD